MPEKLFKPSGNSGGVRKTSPNPELAAALAQRWPGLLLCQQCGECAAVCPVQAHGGIRPAEIMARASLGAVDPGKEESLWRCARCMGCSERCPSSAQPGEVIAELRGLAVDSGNVPAHLVEEAKRYMQTGICFPRTGMTRKMRRELGLPDGEPTPQALEEVSKVCGRTKLGRSRLG
jgi:heterodisulfide reductase subunit C